MSAPAYYQRATGRHSPRQVEDQRLTALIHTIHEDVGYEAYGYRRMWQALLRTGEQVGRGHVKRLMRTCPNPGHETSR